MFVKECVFYNTDVEGTPYFEWQHVSGFPKHE